MKTGAERTRRRLAAATYPAAAVAAILIATFFELDAVRGWQFCGEADPGLFIAKSVAAVALTLLACGMWLPLQRQAGSSYENVRGMMAVLLVLATFAAGFAYFLAVVLVSPGVPNEIDSCGTGADTVLLRALPVLWPLMALVTAVLSTAPRKQLTRRAATWFFVILVGTWAAFVAVAVTTLHPSAS